MKLRGFAIVLALVGLVVGLSSMRPPPTDAADAVTPFAAKRFARAALAGYERALRSIEDPTKRPSSDDVLGPDPYRIVALDHGAVGILRFDRAVVLLDDTLVETARAPLPFAPTALAFDRARGEILVGGELAPYLVRFDGALHEIGRVAIDGFESVRAVTVHASGAIFAVDDVTHQLAGIARDGTIERVDVPAGPVAVVTTSRYVVVASVGGHALRWFFVVDGTLVPLGGIELRQAPVFDVVARDDGDGAIAYAGTLENAPLDRRIGAFGSVDSFVVAVDLEDGREIFERNVSELGVVTPKALALHQDRLRVTGYGSSRVVDLDARGEVVGTATIWPGTAAIAPRPDGSFFLANPLADAWGVLDAGGARYVAAARGPEARARSTASRLGEALVFTTAIAPFQEAAGPRSRFTCEGCHFEGGTDGRTHATGRGDATATTKPLFGLFTNAPHFTRALDTTTSRMIFAELEVAAARGRGPAWFDLADADATWMGRALGVSPDTSAFQMRAAILAYLVDATPRPNPRVAGRSSFTPLEREGAHVFASRCERCHAARTIADDPSSRVPEASWERTIFGSPEAIVFARDGYEKTGVEPYVHEDGARPSSLRRADLRHRFFTGGSAIDLAHVLRQFSWSGDRVFHDDVGDRGADTLDEGETRALLAFLQIL